MNITLKFFARLRDLVGTNTLERQVASNITIAELIETLQAEFPQMARLMPHTAIALNQEFVDWQTQLNEGDEVAFLPPVSGGYRRCGGQRGQTRNRRGGCVCGRGAQYF